LGTTPRLGRTALLALVAAAFPAGVAAAGPATTVSVDAAGRLGPTGVGAEGGVAWRWAREDGASPLARGRYVQLGPTLGVNPAWAQAGVAVEWVPVAVLQLRLGYDAFAFFGANHSLLRFPSGDARFGRAELAARSSAEETGIGHRASARPVLRAKLGPVVLRSQTDLHGYALSRIPGWYYESEYDTLLRETDWLLANRTAAMAELWRGAGEATLLAGPMFEVTRAGAARLVRRRAGAAAFWAPAARWLGFDRLRLYALAGVVLADRNRRGEPFAVLGFGGDADLAGR